MNFSDDLRAAVSKPLEAAGVTLTTGEVDQYLTTAMGELINDGTVLPDQTSYPVPVHLAMKALVEAFIRDEPPIVTPPVPNEQGPTPVQSLPETDSKAVKKA